MRIYKLACICTFIILLSDKIIEKMNEIASEIDAMVQGDDGELN